MSSDHAQPPTAAAVPIEFLRVHSALLKDLHNCSKAAQFNVSCEIFAAALYSSVAHHLDGAMAAEAVESYLRTLHLEDLALACALRNGSSTAWETFVTGYRPLLYSAARAIAGIRGETYARELADSLYAELYGLDAKGAERRRSLLDYFHGRSKLSTWLRTVLAQRHVDSLRGSQYTVSLAEHSAEDGESPPLRRSAISHAGLTDQSEDPDRTRLLPRLRQAVAAAIAALTAPDRLLLSLYYLQELTLAQIATLRGVHEATASRQLDRIRRDLRETVEHSLASGCGTVDKSPAQRGLSPREIQLCFAYALEDWSFDLRRTLAEIVPASETTEFGPNLRKKSPPQRSKLEGA